MLRRSAAAAREEGQVIEPCEKVLPREGATQTLDGGEVGACVPLDLQGALEQGGVVVTQPEDLGLLARGAKKQALLGGLGRPACAMICSHRGRSRPHSINGYQ